MTTTRTPADDAKCFVCGADPHPDTHDPATGNGHNYWSTGEAFRRADEHDRRMTFSQTPEARYVAQHRPY